jgi:peptide/nickel transport system substrate-binding protein
VKKYQFYAVVLIALVTFTTVFFGACKSSTTTPQTTASPAPSTTQATTTKPAATATTVTPKKGGTLKIIYGTSPNAIGYGVAMVRDDDILAASPCVETLFRADSTGTVVPWLATGSKGDPATNTILVTLRQGVKFHDGTNFDAEAAKWNIEQHMAIDRTEVKLVTSIDVVDPYTIRLNLSSFDSRLESNFCSYIGTMVSPTYFKNNGAEATKNYPVGTGPFKFVSFQRDVSLKYTRFDGYWQEGKPYLDNVEFMYIADPMVRLASFQAGEGNVLLRIDAKDAKDLEATGKYIANKGLGILWGLAGDGSHETSPFANIKVRQAIEYALNREPVVKAVGLGYYEVTDQPTRKTTWAYNPTPSPYTYDPAKAKALLAEAGYPNGLGGLPLTTQNDPVSAVDVYTGILEQLNNAGFDLHLDVVDPAKFSEFVIKTGWNNTLLGWNFVEGIDPSGKLTVGFSSFGFPYRSPLYPKEIDDIIAQIIPATDFEKKKALTQQAMALIRDKYCNITTLYHMPSIAARTKAVHDDGFYTSSTSSQTLADCWIDK